MVAAGSEPRGLERWERPGMEDMDWIGFGEGKERQNQHDAGTDFA